MENNERWLSDGKCSECRRRNYCKKSCKANNRRTEKVLASELAKTSFGKMINMINGKI